MSPADSGKKLERQFGELRITARAKEAGASVFLLGRYPPSIQAILEFTDNSFGYRGRDNLWPTVVTVTVERNRINVTDYGGLGTDAEGIKRFARLGETEERGIGWRGAGGKYAAWYFGEDLEIKAKKAGDEVEYSTEIRGFGDPRIEYSGMFAIDALSTIFEKEKGRFEIIVRGLKDPNNLPGGAALRRVLGEVYRPLLSRQIWDGRRPFTAEKRVVVDAKGGSVGVADKVVLFLATRKKKEQVKPLKILLLEGYSEENLKTVTTKEGEVLGFWAGEMDLKNKDARSVKSGLRFYFDGRLINIDFCGFNERDPRLAGLVGEVNLDHVAGIKNELSVNKSAGINIQSDQWRRVVEAIHQALTPLVETMQKRPLPLFDKPPDFLPDALAQARRLADLAVREMAQGGVMISLPDLAVLVGETKGQKLPTAGVIDGESQPSHPKTRKREEGSKSWTEQKGQTIPGPGAIEAIPRIRKSCVDAVEARWLDDDPSLISVFTEREEENGKTRKVLILNCSNPLVGSALLQGELATTELVGRELIENLARVYSTTLDDFLKFKKEALLEFGKLLVVTPAYRKLESQKLQKEKG